MIESEADIRKYKEDLLKGMDNLIKLAEEAGISHHAAVFSGVAGLLLSAPQHTHSLINFINIEATLILAEKEIR